MTAPLRLVQGANLQQFSTSARSQEGLKGGSDGGTYDGMEARVAALEAHMDNVRENVGLIRTDVRQAASDIGTLKIDLGTLKTKVDTLPTKAWGGTAVVALGAFITALTVIVNFGPAILRLLKAH